MGSDPTSTSETSTCTFAFNAADRPADSEVAPYTLTCYVVEATTGQLSPFQGEGQQRPPRKAIIIR